MVKVAILTLALLGGVAGAQPGMTMPYARPPVPQLTAEEMETLSIGYISDGQYIGGGVSSIFLGFGIGQAIEGRWSSTGWIFTLGEPVAFGVMLAGIVQSICFDSCSNNHNDGASEALVGAVALVGLRVWEIVDAWAAPPRHNERYRALQQRLGNPMPQYVRPYIAPASGGGAIAGLSLRF